MDPILHICQRSAWEEALQRGEYRPPSMETEGFIHCSRPEQVLTVVNRFFRDVPDLVLLWIDPSKAGAELRWEPADDDVFPHLYGPIKVESVFDVTVTPSL